jgi:predicted nucleotidyltransferase
MAEGATAAEVARAVADALERHGLPYALGGAIALGFYAAPRATVDVDVNVFVPPADELPRALAALADAGFTPDEDERRLQARANAEGQFRGSIGGMRVDVFVPAIAYYAQLASRRREVTLLGRRLWIVGPEDLVVLKMMFFRRKDLADVEAILRDQQSSLDRQFIRRHLIELVGAEDERLVALDTIERDVDAS